MADVFFAAAALLLCLSGAGLFVLWRGGTDMERMLAIQLLGSSAIAVMLLLAPAMGEPGLLDAALLLALLAAIAACAYRASLESPRGAGAVDGEPHR